MLAKPFPSSSCREGKCSVENLLRIACQGSGSHPMTQGPPWQQSLGPPRTPRSLHRLLLRICGCVLAVYGVSRGCGTGVSRLVCVGSCVVCGLGCGAGVRCEVSGELVCDGFGGCVWCW
jgi:hypothetical protein